MIEYRVWNILLYLLGSLIETAFLFDLFLVSLQVLDHQIFPSQLEMIPVMVDSLGWIQVKVVQYFINCVPFHPKNVPVLTINNNCQLIFSISMNTMLIVK